VVEAAHTSEYPWIARSLRVESSGDRSYAELLIVSARDEDPRADVEPVDDFRPA
jgi:hypothetical protein